MATIIPSSEFSRQLLPAAPLPLRVVWDRQAPAWAADPASWRPEGPGWDSWVRHVGRRAQPRLPAVLRASATSPLLWSAPAGLESAESPMVVAEIARATKKCKLAATAEGLLRTWLREEADRPREAGFALECLAWAYALPRIAPSVSAALWWHALDALWRIADESIELRLESDPLAHQLLAGELPNLLGRLFPEIEDLVPSLEAGQAALTAGIKALLAEDGYPLGPAWELWRPLWGCWTRTRAWSGRSVPDCWDGGAEDRYRRLLLHTLRGTRKDGSQVLSHGAASIGQPELFAAALALVGRRPERAAAAKVLPGVKRPRKSDRAYLPEPACDAESSRVAVLRRDWSAGSEMLTVDYRSANLQIEFQAGRDVLWSGPWTLNVRSDDTCMTPGGPWKNVCWMSDDDVDYLELELRLGGEGAGEVAGEVVVQRQMLLARRERFLLLADAVLGQTERRLAFVSRLPLRPGITFTPATETHEGCLTGRKLRANVLPLALPEWRSGPERGQLQWSEEGLQLSQTARGASLFAPLFIDFDPQRLREPLTWRQLTVAESRAPDAQDRAVAYRVQAGERQWVFYRSLSGQVNRTFLGANLVSEFLCARFTRQGRIVNLLEVEQ